MRQMPSRLTWTARQPEYTQRRMAAVVLMAAVMIGALGMGIGAQAAMTAASPASNGYTLVTKIPLPGPAGHGDWVAYDPGNDLIYLSHHGSNLVVVDPKKNAVVANIESPLLKTPDVMTFDANYVYVTAEDAHRIVVISKKDWTIAGSVRTKGAAPDGIWLDPAVGRLYVVTNTANQLEVYTPGVRPTLIATYPLRPAKPMAGPDVGVLVPAKGTLYETDDSLVLAISAKTGQVTGVLDTHLPIAKNGASKSMVYDPKTNRLWVATTDKQVVILDADMLVEITNPPATEPDDGMSFDPGLRLIYAFGGHGFDVYNADTLQHVTYVNTGSAITHTGAVDPVNHQVYAYEGQANVLGVYAQR